MAMDLYDMWNRLIYDLEESDSDTDRLEEEQPQDLSPRGGFGQMPGPFLGVLLRPRNGHFLGRCQWPFLGVLLLELTRAHDWR